jgi:hypothetical protein
VNRSLAQELKLEVLATGMAVTELARAHLSAATGARPLTPADYASTSGLILHLDGQEWVNAPIGAHNPNFVHDPAINLDLVDDQLILVGPSGRSLADVWVPPAYHGSIAPSGRPWNDFVFTHGDRARLAPIGGCAMACKFCNLPYEDPYLTKPIEHLLAAVQTALDDPVQPARHLLISGGTPRAEDVPYLQDVYRAVLQAFPELPVDIMMAPVDDLLRFDELRDLGIHELSINLEVFDLETSRLLMPHKFRQGRDRYLCAIGEASAALGPGRVRSMLMVGLEDEASTLDGVEAILDHGGVPVLSPFRPDPATPLSDRTPPSADVLRRVHDAALAIAARHGATLGPDCGPCTHNTIAFASGATATSWHTAVAAAS